jgi:hypothetical protein
LAPLANALDKAARHVPKQVARVTTKIDDGDDEGEEDTKSGSANTARAATTGTVRSNGQLNGVVKKAANLSADNDLLAEADAILNG